MRNNRCPKCDGRCVVPFHGVDVRCPLCDGRGYLDDRY